ncbi:hypothetical protein B1808_14080 [Pseudofulvimonas gallinarii]|nr:hypothetical protein B1808_14080 [Pseudofulvimonas gallinarii]
MAHAENRGLQRAARRAGIFGAAPAGGHNFAIVRREVAAAALRRCGRVASGSPCERGPRSGAGASRSRRTSAAGHGFAELTCDRQGRGRQPTAGVSAFEMVDILV